MIDRELLTAELKRLVLQTEDDLRDRAAAVPAIEERIAEEWEKARLDKRTRLAADAWREGLLTQVAAAWVLGSVFVRFCEDNGLLPEPRLSGPGDRLRQATDAQTLYFRAHPAEGERAYLASVFEDVARLPGLDQVFGAHNPLRMFGPSDDGARMILEYWREVDPETGQLRRPLVEPGWDTRFLGDLYQDISEAARKQYALLQTPDFVEEFILDRTLDEALKEFSLEEFRMIDPACGSGHFLLGSFNRLFERWMRRAPQDGPRAAARQALLSVHGVDLNPFAVAIARFRLLVAAMAAAGVRTLAEAPAFTLQVATGDSLLHGPPPGQQVLSGIEEDDPATRHLFATEDGPEVKRILWQRYHAVVANPPYITPKDPAANDAYRRRYPDVCHRQYSLAVPFMQRLFDLAERGAGERPAGFVGQITANSFMKREFGKPVIKKFLAKMVDLTHVIDTSGAYIPGHGTPTVILLGRNQLPVGSTVRAVMGIRGEPSKPADPSKGLVWQAILAGLDHAGYEDDYVSVSEVQRGQLSRHPWSLQGGGADSLKQVIEKSAEATLDAITSEVGFGAVTREDDVYRVGHATCKRVGAQSVGQALPLVAGEEIRDWGYESLTPAIWPYSPDSLSFDEQQQVTQFLWPWKAQLSDRVAYGKTQLERGLSWQEYSMFFTSRFRVPLSIAFAFVATHNHFMLDRGGKVFEQSAPVIKLPVGASEAEHLALLGC